VLVGIRPEDFEDAKLASDRGRGVTITALIDVLESTGSDVYAHLTPGDEDGAAALDDPVVRELQAAAAADAGDAVVPVKLDVIARLDASSKLGEGAEGELWVDTSKLHLFDPDTGERIGR
jgi:multiple sugar transport system ATP-binding protein